MKSAKYRYVLFLIPFLIGVYGYSLIYGDNWLGSIYSAIRLYGMNIDVPESDINIYLQIARWLAALTTTSVIVLLFRKLFEELSVRWRLRNSDVVVVHGDGVRKEIVAKAMGEQVLSMSGKACFEAKKHVLAFDTDAAAIRYLQKNEDKLLKEQEKEIYFSSYEYEASDYAQLGLCVSNSAVNCARLYWKEHWLKEEGIKKIAIIGFGKYAQRVLEQALIVNVMAWRSPIEYYVFGSDGVEFCQWHPHLKEVIAVNTIGEDRDSVVFHSAVESCSVNELRKMDRIIITMDEMDANILYLNRLLSAGITGSIHVRCNNNLLRQIQYMPNQQNQTNAIVKAFGSDEELYTREVVMHGELNRVAKNEHITYVRNSKAEKIRSKYDGCTGCKKAGRCSDCLRADNTWDDLTPFEKASNIAVADHEPIKRHLLMIYDINDIKAKRELCRVEHERWCRFYFLHNWKYGELRNDNLRIHPSLLPFDVLTEEEQEKDWWAYENILNEVTK